MWTCPENDVDCSKLQNRATLANCLFHTKNFFFYHFSSQHLGWKPFRVFDWSVILKTISNQHLRKTWRFSLSLPPLLSLSFSLSLSLCMRSFWSRIEVTPRILVVVLVAALGNFLRVLTIDSRVFDELTFECRFVRDHSDLLETFVLWHDYIVMNA